MAKSARASSKKNSRSKLRATITNPEEEARLQRLSAKLLAIASIEKPIVPASTMDVDEGTKPSTPHPKGVEKKRDPRVKRARQAMSNKLSTTDAHKETAEENSAAEQVKGSFTSTSSQKPSEAATALSHEFKLPIPASFLEESVGPTCHSQSRPTFDEEMFYNALGLFPIANIQGFDEFKYLSLAVS